MILSEKSLHILSTVHPDMQTVVNAVVLKAPFQLIVTAGGRTAEEEMRIWLECHNMDGTPNGKPHLTGCNGYAIGTIAPNGCKGTGVSNHQGGLAVDVLIESGGDIVWDGSDPLYKQLNGLFQQEAAPRNIPITWGGNFPPPSKPDWDHWELVSVFYKV